ncbi:hypothetical protein QYE76_018659 [Lolium multiflorum]|uniref:DUF4218 domain-containing protein n=1 Tax=Lolium multiflorum TaxID=4521 RepID=A0AAD8QJ08_LOLMU|nr:hypothetical protein QYE76_018659 [Lolium multiflorum]
MPKRRLFCEYLRGVMFPFGFASNIANCLNAEGNKLQGLKTHDCHILLQRLLAIGIKDLVKPNMYNMIAELGRFFREICSKTLSRAVVERLKVDIAVILCKLELIYPPTFFDVMVHLAVHLPDEALLRGIPAHDGEVDFTVEVSIVDKEMDKLKLPGESQEENGQDEQDETMHEYRNEDGGDDDDDDDDD